MKLAWATDIHLNFLAPEEVQHFGREVAAVGADFFLVTGDIAEAPNVLSLLEDLAEASGQTCHFVLGNHDFYRGSVADVRRRAADLSDEVGVWLGDGLVIDLAPGIVLTGVDGWGDAQNGSPERSPVKLSDFRLIEDLQVENHVRLIDKLRALGEAEGFRARRALDEALSRSPRRILFATHIPPYREACLYKGESANDDWAPYFTCRAVGDVLLDVAKRNPQVEFTCLAGHSHAEAHYRALPNLEVRVGFADYGTPRVEELRFES